MIIYPAMISQNLFIERHHVQNGFLLSPAVDGRSLRRVFSESNRPESLRKIGISRAGNDLSDRVNIVGWTDVGRSLACDEQCGCATTSKCEFTKRWFQQTRGLCSKIIGVPYR